MKGSDTRVGAEILKLLTSNIAGSVTLTSDISGKVSAKDNNILVNHKI